MIFERMKVADLQIGLGDHGTGARVLLLLCVRLRGHQQVAVRYLLAGVRLLDAQQVERIECRTVIDRGQGPAARRVPSSRLLPRLLALVIGQDGEEEEGRLARRHDHAVILEVVRLPVGGRQVGHLLGIVDLNVLDASWQWGLRSD